MKKKITVLVLMFVSMFIFFPAQSEASFRENNSGVVSEEYSFAARTPGKYKQVTLPGGDFRFRYRYRVEGNRSGRKRASRRAQSINRRARHIRSRRANH